MSFDHVKQIHDLKQALAAWVDQKEERHQMTLDALADVDCGRVMDHRLIQTWADGLGTDAPLPLPCTWLGT